MNDDTLSNRALLIPERHPDHDLFICDVADAALKDLLQQLEHPFYSLSKKPDTNIRRYNNGTSWIEIIPSVKGLATIYDKDILIYCISQIMAKLRKGEPISQRVRINSRELLQFTNRGTAGKDYTALNDALDRLAGTRISTNVRSGDVEHTEKFGLLESASIVRKHGRDGRLLYCDATLSDWVFSAIRSSEVLTLHRDYFRLRKPLERRVYEMARKHCGSQESWKCSLKILHKKSGSRGAIKEFRRTIRDLVEHDHLPDYSVFLDGETDTIIFTNRQTMPAFQDSQYSMPLLDPEIFNEVRKFACGYDPYTIERDWRAWCKDKEIQTINRPEAHFLKFAKTWLEGRATIN